MGWAVLENMSRGLGYCPTGTWICLGNLEVIQVAEQSAGQFCQKRVGSAGASAAGGWGQHPNNINIQPGLPLGEVSFENDMLLSCSCLYQLW